MSILGSHWSENSDNNNYDDYEPIMFRHWKEYEQDDHHESTIKHFKSQTSTDDDCESSIKHFQD